MMFGERRDWGNLGELRREYADPQAAMDAAPTVDTCGRCFEGDDDLPHGETCEQGKYEADRAQARAEITEVLGHDPDALKAELEDLGL